MITPTLTARVPIHALGCGEKAPRQLSGKEPTAAPGWRCGRVFEHTGLALAIRGLFPRGSLRLNRSVLNDIENGQLSRLPRIAVKVAQVKALSYKRPRDPLLRFVV